MFAVRILDFLLAYGFGVLFQNFTIAPMQGLSVAEGIFGGDQSTISRAGIKGEDVMLNFFLRCRTDAGQLDKQLLNQNCTKKRTSGMSSDS